LSYDHGMRDCSSAADAGCAGVGRSRVGLKREADRSHHGWA